MNPLGFFSGLLHSTEQLVGNVARGAAKVVSGVIHPQQQQQPQQRPQPAPAPAPPPRKPAPMINLNALKNALAGVHLQGIEQLTGHPVTVGSVVKGAGDMVNQGVIQPINRGQQVLGTIEANNAAGRPALQGVNLRQFASDAATTGLNFATLGKGKAALTTAERLGSKVVAGLREGGVLGGASGAAQTFADPQATAKDYARNIAIGAAMGAGAGAVAPVVGRGIRIASKATKDAVKLAPQILANESGHITIPGGAPDPKVPRPGMTFDQFKTAHAGDAKAMAAQLGVEVPKVPKLDRQLRQVFDATVSKMKVEAPPAVKPGKSAKIVAPPAPPAIEAPAMKSVGEIMAERGVVPPQPGAKNPGVTLPVSLQTVAATPAPVGTFKIAPESKVGGVPNMSDAGLPAGTAPSRFDRRIAADPRANEDLQASLNANGTHRVLGNEQTVTAARSRIAASEDQAYGYAVRGQGTEANATAMELLAKYLNAGDFEKADELTRAVSPRFTKTGQQMQILAAYSRLTPAGAVRYATQQLKRAADKTPSGAKVDVQASEVVTKLKAAHTEAAKQVGAELEAKLKENGDVLGKSKEPKVAAGELTPEQRLAKRIKASEASKSKEPDPIMDMVNTLTKVAKQSLPEAAKKVQRNPMEFIGQAVKEGGEYERVYEAAKHIVAEKYKDNPAALEELDKYFTQHLDRPYAERQLNQGVQNELKGTDLSAIVRKHFSEVDATGEKLRQRLISEAGLSEADATDLSKDITTRFNQLASERKTAILKQMFKDQPTRVQKSAVDRIVELSNLGGLAREDLHPVIAEKLGVASMTPKLAAEITQMAERIQQLPEGSVERGRAAAEMMAHIAKQIPSTRTDKAIGVWKAGLLTGLKTQTGNAVGNAGNAAIKKLSDAPAALVDKAFSVFTKQRTKTFTVKGLGTGAKEGVGHGIKFLKTGIDERDLTTSKLDTKQLNYKNPVINSYVNGVFKLMGAADRPAYYAALRNNMQDIALAAGKTKGRRGSQLKSFVADFVKNPPDDAVETAVNAADKAVFANDTLLSNLASGARKGVSKYPGGAAAIQIIMPFTKVPSSVITQVFDYTPTGTIKTIIGQLLKGKFDQRAMSEAIGKSATGTIGFIAGGVALANAGLLTGAYPKDPKEQQAWKAEGKTANSILIGGKWRSLNYLAPIGPLLGMGQNIAQASRDGANALGQVSAAVAGGAQTALGQSFLQGVQGVLDAVNDPSRYGLSTAKNMVSSVVPTLVGDIAKATDGLQRQTNGVIDAVKAKIPGLRQTLTPAIDAFGNQLERPGSAAGTLLDPVRSSNTTSTPLLKELDRLQAAGQGVYPTPDKTIQVGGVTVKLTPAQATAYNTAVGQAVQKLWGTITTSKEYQALPDDKKKLALQGALDDIRTLQKQNTLRTDPALEGQYGTLSDKIKLTPRQVALASDKVQPADYINASTGKAINPKSKYQQDLATYKKNKVDGKLTAAADLKATDALSKEAITSKYSQDVLDFYSLSNTQKQAFFKSNPGEAQKLYDQAKQLDSELVGGTGATSRFAKGGGLKAVKVAGAKKGKKPAKPRLPHLKLARAGKSPSLKMPRAKAMKRGGLKVASVKKLSLTA